MAIYIEHLVSNRHRYGQLTVSDLIARFYICLSINHNFLLAIDSDDLSSAIRRAAMVDETTVE